MELRIKTDAAFSSYVTLNNFASEIVHTTGLELLRDQMRLDLAKIEQKRIRRKWKIGAGIIAAILGLSILYYFIKSNEKIKTFTPNNDQKKHQPLEQISNNKINTTENNSISTKDKITSNTITQQAITENKILDGMDKISTATQTQNSADSTHTSALIVERKKEITSEEKIGKNCSISFDAIVQHACQGDQNGSILVEQRHILGGTAPYSFHIDNPKQQSTLGLFSELAKGNYTITITDSKSCVSSKEISVFEKNCTTKKSFSFNPDYGEKWEMQVNPSKEGSFTIYNRAGIIFKNNNFSQNSTIEWDGSNTHGTLADMGMYMCTINYADGKMELIELSIVR